MKEESLNRDSVKRRKSLMLNYSLCIFLLFKEIFFLGLGVILFAIVGALSMASIENVPEDLIDNAAVFGALCLLTALVFIADLLISAPKKKDKHDMTKLLTDKRGIKGNVKPPEIIFIFLCSLLRCSQTADNFDHRERVEISENQ